MRQFLVPASVVCYLLILFFCLDSLNSFCFVSLVPIVPIKTYSNAEADKDKILSDNKNKSGIYKWTNLINGKQYIGSSNNLKRRFMEYFNENYLLKNKSMYICNSLIKHGYSNFSLTILKYCSPDKCLEIEAYYLQSLNPEYNIAKYPTAPMSGRTHSEESKIIISEAKKGEKHPNFNKPRYEGSGRPSQTIEVTDIKNNITTSYDSIGAAARALNINQSSISMFFKNNQQNPYKGRYTFKKL